MQVNDLKLKHTVKPPWPWSNSLVKFM